MNPVKGVSFGLLFVALIVVDLWLLLTIDNLWLAAFLGVGTVYLIMKNLRKPLLVELAILGAFLMYTGAYKFYFQEVSAWNLPPFPDTILVFVGTALVVRATIVVGRLVKLPGFTQFAEVFDG